MSEWYKSVPQEDYKLCNGRNCIFLIYLFPQYFKNVGVLKEFLLGEGRFQAMKDFRVSINAMQLTN